MFNHPYDRDIPITLNPAKKLKDPTFKNPQWQMVFWFKYYDVYG